jgi:hypothetical protein
MKKNLFTITEEEKSRILSIHESATKRAYLSEQTPAPSTTQTTTPTTPQPTSETKVLNDRDYSYKKEGDKYFFKLQTNPASEGAKKFKQANKYVNWTEATGKGLEAIKKLNWGQSEKLATLPVTKVQTNTNLASTTPAAGTTPSASGGGGTPQLQPGVIQTAEKSMPKIKTLDPAKQSQVARWSQTPAGKYIISLPADQREAALNNLEKRSGDKETRAIKNEIRIALGMPADTTFGRVKQGVQGAVQGFKQGMQGNVPPQQ